MKTLKTEIIIEKGAEEVWNKLMQFDRYADWNPFIVKIEGDQKLGGQLQTTIMLSGKPNHFTPIVTKFEPNKHFEWLGSGMMGGFKGRHYFILEPVEANKTKLIHGEYFSGWMSGLIMMMIAKDTEAGFKAMNEALKSAIEAEK